MLIYKFRPCTTEDSLDMPACRVPRRPLERFDSAADQAHAALLVNAQTPTRGYSIGESEATDTDFTPLAIARANTQALTRNLWQVCALCMVACVLPVLHSGALLV